MKNLIAVSLLLLNAVSSEAQSTYPSSRVCFSYAVEAMTYHVTENLAYAAAAGAMPSPSPVIVNYLEVGYLSYNRELMIGINGGITVSQPNGTLRFSKAALDVELGLSGGSIDVYGGLKGFVLINMRQSGISTFNLSHVNVSYSEGQMFGYAVIAGIRGYISLLMIYAEGSLNIYSGGSTLVQWYNTAAIAPFGTVTMEPFSLKGGIGLSF